MFYVPNNDFQVLSFDKQQWRTRESSQQFTITTRVKKKQTNGVDVFKKFLACITEKTATWD